MDTNGIHIKIPGATGITQDHVKPMLKVASHTNGALTLSGITPHHNGFTPLQNQDYHENNKDGAVNGLKCYANPYTLNWNQNSSRNLQIPVNKDGTTPSSNSTKELLPVMSQEDLAIDCVGRRRQPVGEKCFALIAIFFVLGISLASFGATCMIPQLHEGGSFVKNTYCTLIGGLPTSSVLVCGGGLLIGVGISACVLVHECSGKELHGGKCHINCHIFEDLVE